MNRMKCLIMVLTFCILFAMFSQSACGQDGDGVADQNDVDSVIIALTRLDVNDTSLELGWKIINNTDHEVWICDSLDKTSPSIFERFLDEDGRTLVIRRRFDLPIRHQPYRRSNPVARYTRLRAGQEKAESVSIALPVDPYRVSAGESWNAEYAERLALEIGFYDEDLPALILRIVELAEFLNCDLLVGLGENVELGERFFGGRQIAQYYNHIIGFGPNVRSADADGEMWMLHMGETCMGEKVLRIDVDGVSIPYKSNYPPLTGQAGKGSKSKKANSAKLAKADSKEPLERKDGDTGK